MTQTCNPWTVVNVVFNALVERGLEPVLGESGDPAEPAAQLLRALGIEPAPDDGGPASASVQEELAQLRERMLGET